jgi:AcrR family transcriptional regulator
MSRHAEILETAARLFRERGFHGVGVDEIGKQVGISGPALYRHFSSKDEILATLFNEAMDKIAVETQGIFDDPNDELDFLVRHHARFVVNNLELVAIYAHEHRSLVEPFRRMFTKRMREHAARWERVLTNCYPDAHSTDVAITAQAAIGLLHSVVYWPHKLLDSPDMVERLHHQVLTGVSSLASAPVGASDRG